jgi:transposase
MKYYIGCDAHKKYSILAGISESGEIIKASRVDHDRKTFRNYMQMLPSSSQIAVETTGNWYWLIDEMEKAGHKPLLVHAAKAKLMMGQINKTDKLDAHGLRIAGPEGASPHAYGTCQHSHQA